MKKTVFYAFLLATFCISVVVGCRKRPIGFDMTYTRRFQIASGLATSSSHVLRFNGIPSDTAVFFNLHGATRGVVQRVIPRSMNIRNLFSNDANLSNINSVEVSIEDPNRPASPIIIFYRDNVPLNVSNQLDLVPNDVDAAPVLFDSKTFTMRCTLRFKEVTIQTIDVQWDATFLACQENCK
jgi:hypothetical protein